jgi:hypothetical protein
VRCTAPCDDHCIRKLYVYRPTVVISSSSSQCIRLGLATIAFLWITVASLLWPEKVVKEMFVIPIASLFGFTSVRSNMPGAPAGFGESESSYYTTPLYLRFSNRCLHG